MFANGQLLTTYSATGNAQTFALNDWQGTKRVQATAGGEFSMSYASLPYGDNEYTSGAGPNATEQFFTGKVRDSETGNDYFGARYYSSAYGRWLSPDWSAKVEPVPYAKVGDPQSLDLYTYLLDNPISAVDPDGHRCGKASASGCPNPDVQAPKHKGTKAQSQNGSSRRGLTIGVGVSGNADAGVLGAGAEVNGTAVVTGSISSKLRPSVGAAASGGAVAYAGKHVKAKPNQMAQPTVIGGYAGGGVTVIIANTASSKQLRGPFETIQGNVGLDFSLSGGISFDKQGDFVVQFTIGPGVGVSGWGVTTNTKAACAGPGCN